MNFRGIIPPLITPLNADESLDLEATHRMIEHVITGGVHGLFILGTTGEGPSLSYAMRRQYIDTVTEKVNGRIPVIVNVSDTAYAESLALADYARHAGADAVAFTPPYYFIPGGPELQNFVRKMADHLSLPFFLYNMPALTKVSLPMDVLELCFDMPNCLGLKDSSGDLSYFKKVRRLIADRDLSLFIGPEDLLAEFLLAGGNGGICGGANVFPKVYVSIFEYIQQGRIDEAETLQREVVEIACRLFTVGKHGSSIIKGIKGALEVRGLCNRRLASPFEGFHDSELAKITTAIKALEARPALADLL